jgi:hypothetical protein
MFDGSNGGQAFAIGFATFGIVDAAFEGGFLGPTVGASDAFMSKADAALMDVVVSLALHGFHRVVAGHGLAGGAINRPQEGFVALVDDVFRKRFALMEYPHAIAWEFFDGEAFGRFVAKGSDAEGEDGGKEQGWLLHDERNATICDIEKRRHKDDSFNQRGRKMMFFANCFYGW